MTPNSCRSCGIASCQMIRQGITEKAVSVTGAETLEVCGLYEAAISPGKERRVSGDTRVLPDAEGEPASKDAVVGGVACKALGYFTRLTQRIQYDPERLLGRDIRRPQVQTAEQLANHRQYPVRVD